MCVAGVGGGTHRAKKKREPPSVKSDDLDGIRLLGRAVGEYRVFVCVCVCVGGAVVEVESADRKR